MASFRVQVVSDFHAELDPGSLPPPGLLGTGADIVVVAGDVTSARCSIDTACDLFPDTAVIAVVAGNHEHYRTNLSIPDGVAAMRASARHASSQQGRDVVMLENDERIVGVRGIPIRLLGCTLWTDYALHGHPQEHAALVHSLMNDGRRIKGSHQGSYYSSGLITSSELGEQHAASIAFLEKALSERHDGPTIVVTHHLPSARSISPVYKPPVTAGFASNLDYLVEQGAALWVHGHTHSNVEWRELNGGTLVVCNPAGYAGPFGSRENREFNPRRVIAISSDAGDKWVAEAEVPISG